MLPDGVLQEASCSILLELKAPMYRTTGIDQQPHLQRQVGLLRKPINLLRRLVVVKNAEVTFA